MDETKKGYAYALRLLSKRAYPSGMLEEKLAGKGFPPEVRLAVLDKVKRQGYVDDADYIRSFSQEKSRKGYGNRWIESALRKKKLPIDLIRAGLAQEVPAEDPIEAAEQALIASPAFRRKVKPGEDPRRRFGRLYAFLIRRGFSSPVALSAISRALKVEMVDPD